MNNIYRREPVLHKLPTGWNDMDGTKHKLLDNISGLQQIENAVGTDQASTYNCKNVYQDDSNNLTIRPSIRPLKNFEEYDIRGYYKTTNFELWCYFDRYFYLTDGMYDSLVGTENIAVEEFNGVLYVLYTKLQGTLAFGCWNNGLQSVDFDIPANLEDKPIGRLYNLLSDETKFELPFDTLRTLTVSDYHGYKSATAELTATGTHSWLGPIQYYILKTGDVVILNAWKSYLCIAGPNWSVVALDINLHGDNWTIEDNSEKGYFYINDTSGTTDEISFIKHKVSLNGSVSQSQWTIDRPLNGTQRYDTYDYWIGYDNTLVILAIDYTAKKTVLMVYDNGKISFTIPIDGAMLLKVYLSATMLLFVKDEEVYIYDLSNKQTYSNPVLQLSAVGYKAAATEERIYLWDDNKLYYAYAGPDGISSQYMLLDAYSVADNRLYANPFPMVYAADANTAFVIDPNTGFRRIDDIDNLGAVNSDASIYVTHEISSNTKRATITVVERTPSPVYSYGKREISESFPLLSEIKDTVLTSFYLDNVYWFVTKHRIFGTGVADEQFSIKYFDPRKYFHFDEELTAAIRISDTSFWVFHNNGAYLIYKSSMPVYDEISGEYVEMVTWLCTSTAKSKGCDFENAVLTLPILNYVSCVTADDISVAQMRENIQTDEKVLMPLTLQLRSFVSSLLRETESIVTAVYKYNAIFFLNSAGNKPVSALVYNVATESWWYWELPLKRVIYATSNTDTVELVAKNETGKWYKFDLYAEYHEHTIGGLTYSIYADRTGDSIEPITWFWESALQHLGTVEYRKQLLTTNFTLSEKQESMAGFEYSFIVYSRDKTDRRSSQVEKLVNKASTCSCKTVIGSFMYLQIRLQNQSSFDDFTGAQYTKPKFSTISFKYRILPGGVV